MGSVPEDFLKMISEKKYDLIIGIPSYNNEDTISYVAETSAMGLKKYFPDLNACIINSDGGSSDGTRDVFMSSRCLNYPLHSFIYEGIPGKGTAMRSVFEIGHLTGVKAVVFLDSDLRSVKPEWIELLLKPIISEKSSYVTPFYIRDKYDGTITNSICYPLNTILYGDEVRQPIGGDFGVGTEMINIYMNKKNEIWESDISKFGIDIFMTTTAINESKLPVYQANLGSKIHDVKDPGESLGPMFSQVVGTLFNLMDLYKNNWKKVTSFERAPVYGEKVIVDPKPIEVNLDRMIEKCKIGLKEKFSIAEKILSKDLISYLEDVKEKGIIGDEKWVDILFELSFKYREKSLRKEIIELLVPIYFGKTADFVIKTKKENNQQAEERIRILLNLYMRKKSELLKIWQLD